MITNEHKQLTALVEFFCHLSLSRFHSFVSVKLFCPISLMVVVRVCVYSHVKYTNTNATVLPLPPGQEFTLNCGSTCMRACGCCLIASHMCMRAWLCQTASTYIVNTPATTKNHMLPNNNENQQISTNTSIRIYYDFCI